jgi:hypothetical protein
MEFRKKLPGGRGRFALPDPKWLREVAGRTGTAFTDPRHEDAGEDEVEGRDLRLWNGIVMDLESLMRRNDPRNPRRQMRDRARGRGFRGKVAAGGFDERVLRRMLGKDKWKVSEFGTGGGWEDISVDSDDTDAKWGGWRSIQVSAWRQVWGEDEIADRGDMQSPLPRKEKDLEKEIARKMSADKVEASIELRGSQYHDTWLLLRLKIEYDRPKGAVDQLDRLRTLAEMAGDYQVKKGRSGRYWLFYDGHLVDFSSEKGDVSYADLEYDLRRRIPDSEYRKVFGSVMAARDLVAEDVSLDYLLEVFASKLKDAVYGMRLSLGAPTAMGDSVVVPFKKGSVQGSFTLNGDKVWLKKFKNGGFQYGGRVVLVAEANGKRLERIAFKVAKKGAAGEFARSALYDAQGFAYQIKKRLQKMPMPVADRKGKQMAKSHFKEMAETAANPYNNEYHVAEAVMGDDGYGGQEPVGVKDAGRSEYEWGTHSDNPAEIRSMWKFMKGMSMVVDSYVGFNHRGEGSLANAPGRSRLPFVFPASFRVTARRMRYLGSGEFEITFDVEGL